MIVNEYVGVEARRTIMMFGHATFIGEMDCCCVKWIGFDD